MDGTMQRSGGILARRGWTAALLGTAMATGLALGGAEATVINACVKDNGDLRIVAAGEACKKHETPLSGNQQGAQGPAGPAGPQGPAGAAGAQGPAGPAGLGINADTCPGHAHLRGIGASGELICDVETIIASGTNIHPAAPIDLDTGLPTLPAEQRNDLYLQGSHVFVIPPATGVVYGTTAPSYAQCVAALFLPTFTEFVPQSLPAGTFLCIRTGEGNIARVVLTSAVDALHPFRINFVTWAWAD